MQSPENRISYLYRFRRPKSLGRISTIGLNNLFATYRYMPRPNMWASTCPCRLITNAAGRGLSQHGDQGQTTDRRVNAASRSCLSVLMRFPFFMRHLLNQIANNCIQATLDSAPDARRWLYKRSAPAGREIRPACECAACCLSLHP